MQAELQKLKPRRSIVKRKGKTVVSGIFAVEKDEDEDRCIMALCPQNAMMDKRKLWKPRSASMPHVRAIFVAKGRRLRIHKIDGRHFFHMLHVGRRWQKYFASPPLPRVRGVAEKFPVQMAIPMGFAGSASWSQIFNESIIGQAALPQERRLVAGALPLPSYRFGAAFWTTSGASRETPWMQQGRG